MREARGLQSLGEPSCPLSWHRKQSSTFTGARSRCSLVFLELTQPAPQSQCNSNTQVPPWTSLGVLPVPAPWALAGKPLLWGQGNQISPGVTYRCTVHLKVNARIYVKFKRKNAFQCNPGDAVLAHPVLVLSMGCVVSLDCITPSSPCCSLKSLPGKITNTCGIWKSDMLCNISR